MTDLMVPTGRRTRTWLAQAVAMAATSLIAALAAAALVPRPRPPALSVAVDARAAAAVAVALRGLPGVSAAAPLAPDEVARLLAPAAGVVPAARLPRLIDVRLASGAPAGPAWAAARALPGVQAVAGGDGDAPTIPLPLPAILALVAAAAAHVLVALGAARLESVAAVPLVAALVAFGATTRQVTRLLARGPVLAAVGGGSAGAALAMGSLALGDRTSPAGLAAAAGTPAALAVLAALAIVRVARRG